VSGPDASSPVWARNGRELFYIRGSSRDTSELVVHDVEPDGTIAPTGRPLFRLAPIRAIPPVPVPGYDVTPDGRRFVFVQQPGHAAATAEPDPHHRELVRVAEGEGAQAVVSGR